MPRSSAWLTWAWRSQRADTAEEQPGALDGDFDDTVRLVRVERTAALARSEHGHPGKQARQRLVAALPLGDEHVQHNINVEDALSDGLKTV